MNKHKIFSLLLIFLMCTFFYTNNSIYAEGYNLNISSSSVVLIDGNTGQILYKKNENIKQYPASITKLMTALLALENLNINDSITFSQTAVLSIEYGSSHIGIQEDEVLTVNQAMHGLLLMSANEIANGLAEKTSGSIEAFIEEMNNRAEAIGATHSNFVNPHGLHDENHYTTAYDMALIAKELVKNEAFLKIMKDITYEIPPTNKADEIRYLSQQHKMMNEKRDADIYREDVIGGKTGYTNEAGHTLVTISKKGEQVLIAVILDGKGDKVYDDTSALLDFGFKSLKQVTIEQESFEQTIPIIKDMETIGEATITLREPIKVLLDKSIDPSTLKYKANFTELTSAVSEGDIVGKVTIMNEDQPIMDADVTVDKLSINNIIPNEPKKIIPFIFIGLLLLVTFIILISLFINKLKGRRRPTKKITATKKRYKNHYSKYAKKRARE